MTIAQSLKSYLEQQSIPYETVVHSLTQSSMDTAAIAHVSGDRLAKAVIVKVNDGYLMVVVPTDYHVDFGRLSRHLGNEAVMAPESESIALFPDCEKGAIPPLGQVYGLRTLVDNSLLQQSPIFFESGDHYTLIKVTGKQFAQLLHNAERVNVGEHL